MEQQPARKTILIVDDEVDMCLLMKAYYLRKNYLVRIGHTLQDAMLTVSEQAPDFVLLDRNVCSNLKEACRMLQKAAPQARILILGIDNLKDYL